MKYITDLCACSFSSKGFWLCSTKQIPSSWSEIHATKTVLQTIYTHGLERFRSNSAKKQHNKDPSAINKEIGNRKWTLDYTHTACNNMKSCLFWNHHYKSYCAVTRLPTSQKPTAEFFILDINIICSSLHAYQGHTKQFYILVSWSSCTLTEKIELLSGILTGRI